MQRYIFFSLFKYFYHLNCQFSLLFPSKILHSTCRKLFDTVTGLSWFLHRSVFFVLFSAEWRCEWSEAEFTPPRIILFSNRPASLHFIPLRSIPVVHSGNCSSEKKLHSKAKIALDLPAEVRNWIKCYFTTCCVLFFFTVSVFILHVNPKVAAFFIKNCQPVCSYAFTNTQTIIKILLIVWCDFWYFCKFVKNR